MTSNSETIQLAVADGTTMQAYLARPGEQQAGTGVIVAHELFGVNPDIRRVADDLAGPATSPSPRSSTTGRPRPAGGCRGTTPAAARASATCTG